MYLIYLSTKRSWENTYALIVYRTSQRRTMWLHIHDQVVDIKMVTLLPKIVVGRYLIVTIVILSRSRLLIVLVGFTTQQHNTSYIAPEIQFVSYTENKTEHETHVGMNLELLVLWECWFCHQWKQEWQTQIVVVLFYHRKVHRYGPGL